MFEVHIYIETDSHIPRISDKRYGYVLECHTAAGIRTRGDFGKISGTYHKATLIAMIEAMKRLNQTCEVHIHTSDTFVLNMMDYNLERWAGNGFKTGKGEPVTNPEEWKQLWILKRQQLITTVPGNHEYSEWLIDEMKRR